MKERRAAWCIMMSDDRFAFFLFYVSCRGTAFLFITTLRFTMVLLHRTAATLSAAIPQLPTRSAVLSWYRKCIKAAFTVPWATNDDALYVLEESRRLFNQNRLLVDPERIQRKLREVEMRYELALHYRIPYPRPYHKTQGTSNESATTYAVYMDSSFDTSPSPYTASYLEGNGYGGINGGTESSSYFFEDVSGTAAIEGRLHPTDTAVEPVSPLR